MLLERIGVALRPRNPWEAMDLGFRMVRAWWRPVYLPWLIVYLPVIALITLAALDGSHPAWAVFAVWWLKPLMERVPLYVLSRAVFSDLPKLGEVLRQVPSLLRNAPLWRMTFTRLSPTRSFCLPVIVLEGLKGRARRERCALLLKSNYSGAAWLTIVCAHLELGLIAGGYALVEMLMPRTVELNIDNARLFSANVADTYLWISYGATVLAYLIMGPLYVAGGFALYLNRRTMLEAWDIELGFRRMATRLAQHATGLAAVVLLCLGLSLPPPTWAAKALNQPPSNAQAQKTIEQIMRRPEFNTKEVIEEWQYKNKSKTPEREPSSFNSEFFSRLGRGLAWILKGALYLALFAGLVWLVLNRERWLNALRGIKPAPAYQPPQQLFGLDIRPESLPADIATAARALWQQGEARAALSLLYRGALSRLAAGGSLVLKTSDTEGDCLRAVMRVSDNNTSGYFARLTQAWQMVAYAARPPAVLEGEQLCAEFDAHFAAARVAS